MISSAPSMCISTLRVWIRSMDAVGSSSSSIGASTISIFEPFRQMPKERHIPVHSQHRAGRTDTVRQPRCHRSAAGAQLGTSPTLVDVQLVEKPDRPRVGDHLKETETVPLVGEGVVEPVAILHLVSFAARSGPLDGPIVDWPVRWFRLPVRATITSDRSGPGGWFRRSLHCSTKGRPPNDPTQRLLPVLGRCHLRPRLLPRQACAAGHEDLGP